MTDTRPDPTPEAVEAVAELVSTAEWGQWSADAHPDHNRWTWRGDGLSEGERDTWRATARTLLTSTDPAVCAALAASVPDDVLDAEQVKRGRA